MGIKTHAKSVENRATLDLIFNHADIHPLDTVPFEHRIDDLPPVPILVVNGFGVIVPRSKRYDEQGFVRPKQSPCYLVKCAIAASSHHSVDVVPIRKLARKLLSVTGSLRKMDLHFNTSGYQVFFEVRQPFIGRTSSCDRIENNADFHDFV